MRLCKDCKMMRKTFWGSMCFHPRIENNQEEASVSGKVSTEQYCVIVRGGFGECGPDGKLFDPIKKSDPNMPDFLKTTARIPWRIRVAATLRKLLRIN